MTSTHIFVQPGYRIGTVITDNGETLTPPCDWAFLPAGDAAVTRKVKTRGITWVVQVRKGKRTITKGIWARESDISAARKEVADKRATPEYAQRRKQDQARKSEKHSAFKNEFSSQIIGYLNFHQRYQNEARQIARLVTEHATPIGSGTVARSTRIPISQKAEAAVIAWMRHHTTSYDSMRIARIKGKRREVRRNLAAKSLQMLEKYRKGEDADETCPLKRALLNLRN